MTTISPNLKVQAYSAEKGFRNTWNEFVYTNSGTYCHLYEWSNVFTKSYGLEIHYLYFMDEGTLVGICPFAIIKGLSGKRAISLPFCNYGGLLVSQNINYSDVINSVITYFEKFAITLIELRPLSKHQDVNNVSEITMVLEFPENVETLWKQIGDKTRNQVRKAERAGLISEWGTEQVDELYDIYAENMGRLGTPVHSKSFIQEILNAFDERADILTIRLNGQAIAAMLILKYGEQWIDPIASSKIEFKHLNPNMLLYWEALRQAMGAGAKKFDFGRSHLNSGTHKFKKQWGAKEVALNYHTYQNGVLQESASMNLYRSPNAALFAKMWSHFPNSFQRLMGPMLRKYIP